MKTYLHQNPCTVFNDQFICNGKKWEQLECPSIGKWLNKACCIHTTEFDSAIKKNEWGSMLSKEGHFKRSYTV